MNGNVTILLLLFGRTSRKDEQEEKGAKRIFQKNLFPFHFIDNVLGHQRQQNGKKEEVLIYNLLF